MLECPFRGTLFPLTTFTKEESCPAVRHIGKVVAIYDNEDDGSSGMASKLVQGTASPDDENRIRECSKDTKTSVDWDVSSDTRFFCVEKFAPTEFNKSSAGGVMGARVWDVTRYVTPGMADTQLAEALRGQEWDDRAPAPAAASPLTPGLARWRDPRTFGAFASAPAHL